MDKISLVIISLIVIFGTGCGSSSSTGTSEAFDITTPEGAIVRYNDVTVMNTEEGKLSCDLFGENCYSFATNYYEEGGAKGLTIIVPSGRRISMYFVSNLVTGRTYKYRPNLDFMDQDLRFYATYDTNELDCDGNCDNVYNYSDTWYCNSDIETCKYYEIKVRENTEDYLDVDFELWNKYFLGKSDLYSNEGHFEGRIRIDKKAHTGLLRQEYIKYPEGTTVILTDE